MSTPTVLLDKLRELKPKVIDDFCRLAIDGAICALTDVGNPLRLNYFSTAVRILYEHTMRKLASGDDVKKSPWFDIKRATPAGNPTRGQRIQFAIQGGLSDTFLRSELGINIDPMRKALIAAVDDLGKHVHGEEDTIILDRVEQDREASVAIAALTAFLDTYAACRQAIVEPIQEHLDAAAVDALLAETIQEVDELATHHSVEEIYVAETVVRAITAIDIVYRATGTLSVGLQWGSNSDVRRGDGAEIDKSFPFHCDITVPLEDLWDPSLGDVLYGVDTSEWVGAMQPDE